MSTKICLSESYLSIVSDSDILRIPEKYRKYRYANISQPFYTSKKLW